ncbi:MAG: hypothetical protein QM692_20450 [Thermomicrobiales bacterium]
MADLDQTIRRHLQGYLANQVSLNQLTEVIVDAIWSLPPDQEDALTDRIYAVQLALAELSDKLLTEDEFRAELREVLSNEPIPSAA